MPAPYAAMPAQLVAETTGQGGGMGARGRGK